MGSFALWFRTLVVARGWNETALLTVFCHGLIQDICQFMIIYDDVIGLETFIQKAIRVSQRYSACATPSLILQPPPTIMPAAPPPPEPMSIDSYHLTPAERQWRLLHPPLPVLWGRRTSDSHLPGQTSWSAVSTIHMHPKTSHLIQTIVHILTHNTSFPA